MLFDRHAPLIHRYLSRRVGRQAADDLVTETFLAAFGKRPARRCTGLAYRDKTVPAVLAMLRRQHVTALFRDFHTSEMLSRGSLRGTWYVYGATPWAPQQVLFYVGTRHVNPMGNNG